MKLMNNRWKKTFGTIVMTMVLGTSLALAEGRPYDTVQVKDWEYQALLTLVKHGAITDLHGIELGERTYKRYELTPLISDVVEKRETMNESDRMLAIRLYDLYRRDILSYRAQEEDAKKLKQEEIQIGKNGELIAAEKKVLSTEELRAKMDKFVIDDSAIVSGDARVRIHNRGRADARTRIQFVLGGKTIANEAPSILEDKEGRAAIEEADKELAALKKSTRKKEGLKKQQEMKKRQEEQKRKKKH